MATPIVSLHASGESKASSVVAAAAFTANGSYQPVLTIRQRDRYGGRVRVTCIVSGTGPLTGFQLVGAATFGSANTVPLLTDADFNTASAGLLPFTTGSATAIQTAASGTSFQIVLNLDTPGDYTLNAKASNATTLAFEVSG